MAVRAVAAVVIAIGIVAATVTLAAPASTQWSVPVSGSSNARSHTVAQQLCGTIGTMATFARESYVLRAAIPTTDQAAESWVAGTPVPSSTTPALPAVVCVVHTQQTTYAHEPLSPNIVTVIVNSRSVKRYFMAALPSQNLIESNVPPLHVWI
jgi:hypothetical protein